MLKELMSDCRRIGKEDNSLYRYYLIKFDKDDPYNTDKMKVINSGGWLSQGYTRFDNKPKHSFEVSLPADPFLSYNVLILKIREALRDHIAVYYEHLDIPDEHKPGCILD